MRRSSLEFQEQEFERPETVQPTDQLKVEEKSRGNLTTILPPVGIDLFSYRIKVYVTAVESTTELDIIISLV